MDSDEGAPTAHKPTKKQPSSQSSPLNQKVSEAAHILPRNSPLIQPDSPSAASRDVPQQAPPAHNVLLRPTSLSSSAPPEQRFSRPNAIERLLNPIAGDTTSAGGRQYDSDGTDFPWTAPRAVTSRPTIPTLPPTSMKHHPSGDIDVRSMTPRPPRNHGPYLITTGPPTATIDTRQPPTVLPRDQASALTGSGPLLPSEIMTGLNMLRAAHPPPVPLRPSPCVETQFGRIGNPALWTSGPSLAPFTSMGPVFTSPQLAFDNNVFNVPTSEPSQQSQYQIETEQGPIQVFLDYQTASKAAEEKRKRCVTYNRRYKQRREEKDQKISIKISGLEAKLSKMTKERDYYRQEQAFLQDLILRYHIPIPRRPSLTKVR